MLFKWKVYLALKSCEISPWITCRQCVDDVLMAWKYEILRDLNADNMQMTYIICMSSGSMDVIRTSSTRWGQQHCMKPTGFLVRGFQWLSNESPITDFQGVGQVWRSSQREVLSFPIFFISFEGRCHFMRPPIHLFWLLPISFKANLNVVS